MTHALLVAIAVAAVAWFVIGARQAHDIAVATTLLGHQADNLTVPIARTSSLLSSADFLDPGEEVTLLRIRLDLVQRRFADAKVLMDGVLAAEPNNLDAWILDLALSIDHPSAHEAQRAIAAIRRLDPLDAGSLLQQ
jgi:hypothetical protein